MSGFSFFSSFTTALASVLYTCIFMYMCCLECVCTLSFIAYSGEPKSFTLQFRPAENFPLDVYLLVDVTGSFSFSFRETVPRLATELCMCT